MQSIYTGHPVFIALDLGLWDTTAREKMTALLNNRDALIATTLMFQTPEGQTERSAMQKILNHEVFVRELTEIQSDSALDSDTRACVRLALRKDDWS
jgi:hypothetical protein